MSPRTSCAGLGGGAFCIKERLPGILGKGFAGRGQLDSASTAFEQSYAEFFFEVADLLAE